MSVFWWQHNGSTELLVAMAVVWGLGGRKCGLLGSCLHCSAHSKTLGGRDAWPLVQFLSHPVLSAILIFEQFCLSLSGSSSLSSMLVTNPCIQCLLLEIPRVRDLQWHRMAYDLRGNPGECLFCKPSKESVSRRKECSVVWNVADSPCIRVKMDHWILLPDDCRDLQNN